MREDVLSRCGVAYADASALAKLVLVEPEADALARPHRRATTVS